MTLTVDMSAAGRTAVIAFFAAVALAIAYLGWRNFRHWAASRRFERTDLESMRRRWREIESLAERPEEAMRKMAILDADKLLDSALKSMMMSGSTLGERLKFACYRWPDLRQVWWAHKIRNQLAHEPGFRLDGGTARKAIRSYRSALNLIGAI